jgi:hypothetical protein
MHYIAVMEQASGSPNAPRAKAGRVSLPLIARDAEPTVLVTNENIEDAFDAVAVESLPSCPRPGEG